MASFTPREIDEYFLLDIILVFLMINYNLPLATIYFAMVMLGTMMYYVAVDKGFFRPIPFFKSKKKIEGIFLGAMFGVGFLVLYNYLKTGAILFSATAFGESQFLGMLVFGVMIAAVETRFFFRTLMQWFAWKTKLSTSSPFKSGLILIISFATIFTLFHATAYGLESNTEYIATFIFGGVSVGMVLFYQQIVEATVMHIIVNSKGVGLIDMIIDGFSSGTLLANPWFLGIAGATLLFTFRKQLGIKLPFAT